MHELSLVQEAIDQALAAAQHAGALRIERLTFKIAADSQLTLDTLQTLVGALGRGTELADAKVDLDPAPSTERELSLVSIDVEAGRACAS